MAETRLIDANALKEAIGDLYGLPFEEMVKDFIWLKAIDNAPTVNLYTADGTLIHTNDNNKDKSKTCDKCMYYLFHSTDYPCAKCRRNNALVDEIREQQNDRWKDGTTNG